MAQKCISHILLMVVIWISALKTSNSLKCYLCKSIDKGDCGMKFDPENTETQVCPSDSWFGPRFLCGTRIGVHRDLANLVTYERSCFATTAYYTLPHLDVSTLSILNTQHMYIRSLKTCNTDLCNVNYEGDTIFRSPDEVVDVLVYNISYVIRETIQFIFMGVLYVLCGVAVIGGLIFYISKQEQENRNRHRY